jgi:hypothetical protein
MSILCLLGIHRRSLTAIVKRESRYVSLCERCGHPMVKRDDGKWVLTEPL